MTSFSLQDYPIGYDLSRAPCFALGQGQRSLQARVIESMGRSLTLGSPVGIPCWSVQSRCRAGGAIARRITAGPL